MHTLFLKIAGRYLLMKKLYSFINILGLAIGSSLFSADHAVCKLRAEL